MTAANCAGCGVRLPLGQYDYCPACAAAVNRLVARGVYFGDHTRPEWRDLIRDERLREEAK